LTLAELTHEFAQYFGQLGQKNTEKIAWPSWFWPS